MVEDWSEVGAADRPVRPSWLRPETADRWLAFLLGDLAVGLHYALQQPAGAVVDLPTWVGTVILVWMAFALAYRRTHPGGVMTVVGLLTVVYYLVGQNSPAGVVLVVFALYAITAYSGQRTEGVASLLASLVFMTLSFVVGTGGSVGVLVTADYALTAFVFITAWALGDATRTRLALTDELRARNAQLATLRDRERDAVVRGERRRIARELHDVISHTVSVVVVQAGAARRVADRDPDAVTTALGAIERAARDAMSELRSMLGLLRDEEQAPPHAPVPDDAAVRALVEDLAEAGMPVRLEGDVPDDVTPGVALTVHRVVQEALTNVLRHAEDVTSVRVRITHDGGWLEVEVVDDGRPAGFTAGAGAGLVGMRERAAIHGGTVEAAPLHGGRGFRVHVSLPTRTPV